MAFRDQALDTFLLRTEPASKTSFSFDYKRVQSNPPFKILGDVNTEYCHVKTNDGSAMSGVVISDSAWKRMVCLM